MAIGTLTAVSEGVNRVGKYRATTYDVQLTSGANYAAGGATITPQAVGLGRRIVQVQGSGTASATSGGLTARSVAIRYQTDGSVKLQVMTTASAEAADNSDQSGFATRLTFLGK
jgi:hypothetical protein